MLISTKLNEYNQSSRGPSKNVLLFKNNSVCLHEELEYRLATAGRTAQVSPVQYHNAKTGWFTAKGLLQSAKRLFSYRQISNLSAFAAHSKEKKNTYDNTPGFIGGSVAGLIISSITRSLRSWAFWTVITRAALITTLTTRYHCITSDRSAIVFENDEMHIEYIP